MLEQLDSDFVLNNELRIFIINSLNIFGRVNTTRTCDLYIPNVAFYLLNYYPWRRLTYIFTFSIYPEHWGRAACSL